MELLQLKYFRVIARTQNISKAAEELHITQPSLSKTLKRLETELGVPLFDRHGKKLVLNECGQRFDTHVHTVFDTLKKASDELEHFKKKTGQKVYIYLQSASLCLPELLAFIKEKAPALQLIVVHNDDSRDKQGNRLIISSRFSIADRATPCEVLLEEEVGVAFATAHPLAKKETLWIKDLSDEVFLGLHTKNKLTGVIAHYCALNHFQPQMTTWVESPTLLKRLVEIGQGIAFIPDKTWGDLGEGIQLQKIADMPMKRYVVLEGNIEKDAPPEVLLCKKLIHDYFLSV